MKTGTTNEQMKNLISELEKSKTPLWKRVAYELARATRQRRAVNLDRLEKYAKLDETSLVPGKVLASGNLTKKITIAAWQFSKQAEEKIRKAGGFPIMISDLFKKNPEGKKVRLIG
jgi:large subunit ribosomal protein L18e